jgi:hypothetical protein
MPEACGNSTFSRKACLADFLDDDDDDTQNMQHNKYKHYSQNDKVVIAKNQQEFGHRKRIKP